jgi:polysaccharide biosynthesis/export protein
MQEFIKSLAAVILLSGCASSFPDQFSDTDQSGATQRIAASEDLTSARAEPTAADQAAPGATLAATGALQNAAAAVPAGQPDAAAYKIGPQDVIDVSVFMVPELSKTVQVSDAGTISLPLLSEVPIAGKTGREVEKELTRRLKAKYLQNPQVTVFVKEYNSQRITIEGAVKRPGVFAIQGGMSLLQAIATAQGFEDTSDDTVLVFRNNNGQRQAARFDLADIRTGSSPDPQLIAGDVVVAGTSVIKKSFNGFLKVLPVAGLFTLL